MAKSLKFTTNKSLLSDLLAKYKTTFAAFCELVNNAIQAKATKIEVSIDYPDEKEILATKKITKISIKDNGVGVSPDEIESKLLQIGTQNKPGGRGVGRFSAFQIGKRIKIETVGKNYKDQTRTKSSFFLSLDEITKDELEKNRVLVSQNKVSEEESTSYHVEILDIYNDLEVAEHAHRKIHSGLLSARIREEIFIHYPLWILENKVTFIINGSSLRADEFLLRTPKTVEAQFTDHYKTDHDLSLTFLNYSSKSPSVLLFIQTENAGVKTTQAELTYSVNTPDVTSWVVYVDSKSLSQRDDLLRGLQVFELDNEARELIDKIKNEIDEFFFREHQEYFNFSKKISEDQFYPFKTSKPTSCAKKVVFDQIAYHIEEKYSLLQKANPLRQPLYFLIEKAVNNNSISEILSNLVSLDECTLNKFNDLLLRCDLDDIIQFSEKVARKTQFLDFLHDLNYSDLSKKIKERSQLHKMIEKELWLFGEQYADTPVLFSDKKLENNLKSLRDAVLPFTPSEDLENVNDEISAEVGDITDLFFFNERILSENNREIMIVELKSPKCKISGKELAQVDKYQYSIETKGVFSKSLDYKIILVSSDLTGYAKSKVGQIDPRKPNLYSKSKEYPIECYVYSWSDIIALNRVKLSFLGHNLSTRDRSATDVFVSEYSFLEESLLKSNILKRK